MSVIGQCLFCRRSRPVIERLHRLDLDPEAIERLADHITRFSAGAMREMRKKKEPI